LRAVQFGVEINMISEDCLSEKASWNLLFNFQRNFDFGSYGNVDWYL